MKKYVLIFSLITALVSCATHVYGQGGKQFVKVKLENLRKAPEGQKIGELIGGAQVEVVERRTNWVKVRLTGWIWAASLDPDSTHVEGYQIRVSHILVKTEQEANTIRERLAKGETFESVAREYSIDKASAAMGGDIGTFGHGDLSPALSGFETAAFQLKPGTMSGAVKTDMGYHIIKRTQ